jgi:hypothetical protein
MLQIAAPWSTWWQADLPCFFSQQQTALKCEFLTEALGQTSSEIEESFRVRKTDP